MSLTVRGARVGRSASFLGAVGMILLGWTGCNPGIRSVEEVWILPRSLPVDDLRAYRTVDIGIRNDLGQPIVEVAVFLPDEVEPGPRGAPRGTLMRSFGQRDYGSYRMPYWGTGELAPGALGVFPIRFSFKEAEVGDTLVFPLELVLADSSIVRWDGPPGSERPAPRLVVRRAWRVGIKTALLLGGSALIPIFMVGALKARHRGRRAK